MRLIITRHGETKDNLNCLIQGKRDSQLTKRGIRQAKALADRLKKEKIGIIYTSFLSRSIKTAEAINKYHHLKIVKNKLLNERNAGVFEGKNGLDINKEYPRWNSDPYFKPKKGESVPDVMKRVKRFLKTIKNKDKNILIVGHKIANLSMIAVLLKKKPEQVYHLHQGHTCINIIRAKNNKAKITKFNDTKHLSEFHIKKIRDIRGIV